VARGHRAEERRHHVRRERHVVEVCEVGDPLAFAETAGFLQVAHDDVDRTNFEHAAESIRPCKRSHRRRFAVT
jgi:hypothetical protein